MQESPASFCVSPATPAARSEALATAFSPLGSYFLQRTPGHVLRVRAARRRLRTEAVSGRPDAVVPGLRPSPRVKCFELPEPGEYHLISMSSCAFGGPSGIRLLQTALWSSSFGRLIAWPRGHAREPGVVLRPLLQLRQRVQKRSRLPSVRWVRISCSARLVTSCASEPPGAGVKQTHPPFASLNEAKQIIRHPAVADRMPARACEPGCRKRTRSPHNERPIRRPTFSRVSLQ
jgi:hypothetical protein